MLKDSILKHKAFWIVALVSCLTILPFLGLTDYHTKGEPRESVLSMVMLDKGEWLLPRIIGGEMGYKPPFFQWCIAALSAVFGGEVTEGTSRLPSALALIGMTLGVFSFVEKRRGTYLALLTSLLTLSNFELHRAGVNCRVDMVLTACIVGATLLMASDRAHLSRRSFPAILLLSLGTLTKGPVGSVLPCLIVGVYLLLSGEKFWPVFRRLFILGLLSLIIPAFWYVAAYMRAGQEFLDLMLEENVGRMTGTMTYVVHDNPWPINFAYVLSGFLPYTLILIVGAFVWKIKNKHKNSKKKKTQGFVYSTKQKESLPKRYFAAFKSWLGKQGDIELLSWTAFVVVFVFYCIPQSKRSVYLMPIYPFISYLSALVLYWMQEKATKQLRYVGNFFAAIGLMLLVIFIVAKLSLIPDKLFLGKNAEENLAILHAIEDIGGIFPILCIIITSCLSLYWIWNRHNLLIFSHRAVAVVVLIMGIYLSLDGAYQPAVLNTKSVRPVITEVNSLAPESEGVLYEYIEEGRRSAGDPLHMYELNFYLGNRLDNFYTSHPQSGFLVISQEDAKIALNEYRKQGYVFIKQGTLSKKIMKKETDIYRFNRQ